MVDPIANDYSERVAYELSGCWQVLFDRNPGWNKFAILLKVELVWLGMVPVHCLSLHSVGPQQYPLPESEATVSSALMHHLLPGVRHDYSVVML